MRAQPAPYPCIRGDQVLNHLFQENCKDTAFAANLKTSKDVVVTTNSIGLRMGEVDPKAEKIAVIGDSYTEGFGLKNEESFPASLEKKLQKFGKKVQVINGGTLGFSPVLYPEYYRHKIHRLKPKVVILNLDFSDITDSIFFSEQADFTNGEPAAFPGRDVFPPEVAGFIYQNHSAFLRFLHSEVNAWARWKWAQNTLPKLDAFIANHPALVSKELLRRNNLGENCWKPYELTTRYIWKLKELVEADGAVFAIHMYLPGYIIKGFPPGIHSISFWQKIEALMRKDFTWACDLDERGVPVFREIANKWHIAFFDSRAVTRGKPQFYFDLDSHWNAEGVGAVTANLAPQVFRLLQSKRKMLNTGNETPRPRL